jgi:hypothetical protein
MAAATSAIVTSDHAAQISLLGSVSPPLAPDP